MIDYIKNFEWNGWLGIMLYWLPAVMCAYGYTARTWINYRRDIEKRAKAESQAYYSPTDTIGSLIGRALITILPVGNLLAAVFDVAPEVFGRFFDWVEQIFNQPLVPRKPKVEE